MPGGNEGAGIGLSDRRGQSPLVERKASMSGRDKHDEKDTATLVAGEETHEIEQSGDTTTPADAMPSRRYTEDEPATLVAGDETHEIEGAGEAKDGARGKDDEGGRR